MEVAHISVWRRTPERFWGFYGQRFATLEGKRPNGAHRALAALEAAGRLDAVITQNIDGLHAAAGSRDVIEVHGSIATAALPGVRGAGVAGGDAPAAGGGGGRGAALRVRAAAEARRGAVRRAARRGGDEPGVGTGGRGRPAALHRFVLEVYPVAGLPELTLAAGGRVAIVTQGATPYDGVAVARLSGDVEDDLEALVSAIERRH